jgi:hypothetical protein
MTSDTPKEGLLRREDIPEGCHWKGATWHEPEGLKLDEEMREKVRFAAAYYERLDALRDAVATHAQLVRAQNRHRDAVIRLRQSAAPSEYVGDLPSAPWVIDGHLVDYEDPHRLRITPVTLL